MAILFPDIETIRRLHQPATQGELKLLDFLTDQLSNEYEIFFQPLINGDNPDIVVVRKEGGVIIFEVKDWNLNHYTLDEKNYWRLKKDDTYIKSPLEQLRNYKENLVYLHIDGLLEKKLSNKYYFSIIQCAVYFHNASEDEVNNFILQNGSNERYDKFLKYYELLGKDSLTSDRLDGYLEKTGIRKPSRLFNSGLYDSFKRYLKPPFHQLEEGKQITYTSVQKSIIESQSGQRRKFKGFAGCGKTMILAKRAVNAHKRTNDTVLVLTFNLALKNYIHDRINDVREDFFWKHFYIDNYHQFFLSQANNYNLPIKSLEDFQDVNFFENVHEEIIPYKTVFIDEAQDYKTEWIQIITRYFITDNSEFIVFGDEKQNIYDRPIDENSEPVIATIPGRWNKQLNASRRFTVQIGTLALRFQNEFFQTKYSLDELEVLENPELDFSNQTIKYYDFGIETSINDIFEKYKEIVTSHSIHPSDVGILSSRVEIIRELDHLIRSIQHEKTKTTFETEEFYNKLSIECGENREKLNDLLENIRRYKKCHFWFKTGTVKLSTIHSFKGWEIHSLFLIIENEDSISNEFSTSELIYTGLTRARINLFILNLGNNKYHNFFFSNHLNIS